MDSVNSLSYAVLPYVFDHFGGRDVSIVIAISPEGSDKKVVGRSLTFAFWRFVSI